MVGSSPLLGTPLASAAAPAASRHRPLVQLLAALLLGALIGNELSGLGGGFRILDRARLTAATASERGFPPERVLSQLAADVAAIKGSVQLLHGAMSTGPNGPQPRVVAVAPAADTVAHLASAYAVPPAGPVFINSHLGARNVSLGGVSATILALPNDEFVGGHILSTGQPFEPATLALMLAHAQPGSTVVDAGCNFGSYSVFFAAKVGPSGRVHCFEPQKKMAQLANANAVANGLSSVMSVHNVALSFAPGSVEMAATVADGTSAGKSMRAADAQGSPINYGGMKLGKGGEAAAAVTLDSLALDNISLIKIDVQGAEQLMLYGAQDTIRRSLPVVVYEHLLGWNVTQDMIERMAIPQEVLAWSINSFFASLGYSATRSGIEIIQQPPKAHRPMGPALPATVVGDDVLAARAAAGVLENP